MNTLARGIAALLAAMLFPTFVSDTSIAFSNSVLSVVCFAAIFALLSFAQSCGIRPRMKRFAYPLGLIYAILMAFGSATGATGSVPYASPAFWGSILLFAYVIGQGIACLWTLLERRERCFFAAPESADAAGKGFMDGLLKHPAWTALLLFACWLPCYISTFPGNFVYDASWEYYQLEQGFTRSYPLLHSVIITRLLHASELLTGSINPGIAVYTLAQMAFLSGLFAAILCHLRRLGVRPAVMGALTAYYAAFPAIPLLATCTTRDVLFAAMLIWLVLLLFLFARAPLAFFSSRRNRVALGAALVLTLLARNNNSGPLMPMLLVLVCILLGLVLGLRHRRLLLPFCAAVLGAFCALNAVLAALCQPLYDSPLAGSMSALAQPLVRAYMLHGEEWTPEERAEFASYFNMDTLEYIPQNADPAKGNLKVSYANVRPYLAFFVKMGLRHPGCYLDGWLNMTRQMWFPDCVINGYNVRGMQQSYEKEYFYFGRYVEEIGSRLNLWPSAFAFYENIGLRISFERVPVVSMLFSIGFQFWLLLHAVFLALYRKSRALLLPLSVLLLYVLLSAFAPLVLVRYYGGLLLGFPLVAAFTLCPALGIRQEEA